MMTSWRLPFGFCCFLLAGCSDPLGQTGPSDTDLPQIEISNPAANQLVRIGPLQVVGTARDSSSLLVGLTYRLNGSPPVTVPLARSNEVAFAFPIQLPEPGTHAISIEVADEAGNRANASISVEYRPVGFAYQVVPVATDLKGRVIPVDLNDKGAVLVVEQIASTYRSYLYQQSAVSDLGLMIAADLNNAGQVVGNRPGDHTRPLLWQNGQLTDFHTCGGGWFWAKSINEAGVVAGSCGVAALIEPGGEVRIMPGMAAGGGMVNASGAASVNAASDVVGQGALHDVSYLIGWWGGVPRVLTTSYRALAAVTRINDSGHVVGYASAGRTSPRVVGYLWDREGVATDLGSLAGDTASGNQYVQTHALDLNEKLEVVGRATVAEGDWRGFLWRNGALLDLSDLLLDRKWLVTSAVSINETGDILATVKSREPGSEEEVVLLRRTPGG